MRSRTFVLSLLIWMIGAALVAQELPKPSGSLQIGTASLKTKSGELLLLWYPSERTPGQIAPYLRNAGVDEILKAGYYGQKPETISSWSSVRTHSRLNTQPRSGHMPLAILMPGAGVLGFQYTTLAEDLASNGYVVVLVDYFALNAPERKYDGDDSTAMENDMARAAEDAVQTLSADFIWSKRLRLDAFAAIGHSIGGSAAIALQRLDKHVAASVDMDGGTFGLSAQGAVRPTLVIQSKPIYSDADFAKRGLTREQWEKRGEKARAEWAAFSKKSGTAVEAVSVAGTQHFSFSDAPFVMPDAVNRFGGKGIDRQRGKEITTTCVREFLDRTLLSKKAAGRCSSFEEVTGVTQH